MKKLKCESCGGDIEIDESKNIATCPFCQTKYQLNEKKEILIKVDEDIKKMTMDAFERNKKMSKIIAPIIIFVFVLVFGIIAYTMFQQASGTSSFDISRFNSKIEAYKGTQNESSVGYLIDNVVTNNKTNKRKITVIFGDVKTTDPDKIVDIKKELKDWTEAEYEIVLDYDKKGFVEVVKIEEVTSKIKEYKDKYGDVTGNMDEDDESYMDEFDEQMDKAKEAMEEIN